MSPYAYLPILTSMSPYATYQSSPLHRMIASQEHGRNDAISVLKQLADETAAKRKMLRRISTRGGDAMTPEEERAMVEGDYAWLRKMRRDAGGLNALHANLAGEDRAVMAALTASGGVHTSSARDGVVVESVPVVALTAPALPTERTTKEIPQNVGDKADSGCFNRFSDIWSASEIGPSDSQCRAAVMNGNTPQLRRVAGMLRKKYCLRIVAIGGSITLGHGVLGLNATCAHHRDKLSADCAALCTRAKNREAGSSRNDSEWYKLRWNKLRCGDSVAKEMQCGNRCAGATTWWEALARALDLTMPCVDRDGDPNGSGRHHIVQHAHWGAGTGFWIQQVQTNSRLLRDIRAADLLIFDTAVNDDRHNTRLYNSTHPTEILIWQLEKMAPHVAKVWATVGWRSEDAAITSEPAHREVLAYYNIPQISLIEGLLTPQNCAELVVQEDDASSPSRCTNRGNRVFKRGISTHFERREYINCTFKPGFTTKYIVVNPHNTVHPGNLGGQLVAAFIATYLLRLRDEKSTSPPASFPATPQWIDASVVNELVHAKHIVLKLSCTAKSVLLDEHVLQRDGFDVYEDAKGKPGLISTTTGARFIVGFQLDPDFPCGGPLFIAITLLSSYAHVGIATLSIQTKTLTSAGGGEVPTGTVAAVAPNDGGSMWRTRAALTVDCKWSSHTSEPQVHHFQWTPTVRDCAMEHRVVVEVDTTAREVNKVKIYSIEVYSLGRNE